MGFTITTQSASTSPKTHTRHFSRTPENAYRRSQVENPGARLYSPALGRWASRDPVDVRLDVNWKALGFPQTGVALDATHVAPGGSITVQPGRGWLLVAGR